ncbi:MAG: flap endonuclease-1 [Thermofilum sp. ex4484_15]|nr:MAG: flap endonuclease-1 [Thermofilum sp. ex4484_15]
MGVDLKDLIVAKREISLSELRNRVIAIDAYNALYQFLATIRQPDGTPLMDSQGRITSHLNGLLYRTVNLLEEGIKLVYVFDGIPPEIKKVELLRRMKHKEEALRKYEEALKTGDLRAAKMYAQQTSKLTEPMVEDAKKLLDLLGIPWVQAPSEGEAQAAYMAAKGDAWASASQDYDSLLYGTPRLIRNLTISGRRKLPRRDTYVEISPELIALEENLRELGITRSQLIDIAILLGTDYNPEGVKGIGPKKALKLIKELGSLDKALKLLKGAEFPVDPQEIREAFLKPKVTDNYSLRWRAPDEEGLVEFLCEEHDFSEERVRNAVRRALKAFKETSTQSTLEEWFK